VIRVLIVDDHPLIRDAVADLLTDTGDICVVGECADGSEVAEAAARTEPDVVLMDLQMPRMSGLEAARALRVDRPEVRVVLLTGSLSAAATREALALRVAAVVLKGEDADLLPGLIRAAAGGGAIRLPAAACE
jgi:DNA-binding NarL/FixJ family response regulator